MTSQFFLGLDLGQAQDHTALAVVQRVELSINEPNKMPRTVVQQHLRHLERFKLGTSYPAIVARMQEVTGAEAFKTRAVLGVDATGVGAPVVDLLRQAKLPMPLIPIIITGGNAVNYDQGADRWNVPKRDLVGVVQVLLHSERLKIAEGLPEAKTLVNEMLSFQVKISDAGKDSYGAWREGQHDDLLLAAAIACWLAERKPAPGVVQLEFTNGLDD